MSALGQKQTSRPAWTLSALPLKADKAQSCWHVRFVPKADIARIITSGPVTIVKRGGRTGPLPRVGRIRRAILSPAPDHPQHRAPRPRPILPALKGRSLLSNAQCPLRAESGHARVASNCALIAPEAVVFCLGVGSPCYPLQFLASGSVRVSYRRHSSEPDAHSAFPSSECRRGRAVQQ